MSSLTGCTMVRARSDEYFAGTFLPGCAACEPLRASKTRSESSGFATSPKGSMENKRGVFFPKSRAARTQSSCLATREFYHYGVGLRARFRANSNSALPSASVSQPPIRRAMRNHLQLEG